VTLKICAHYSTEQVIKLCMYDVVYDVASDVAYDVACEEAVGKPLVKPLVQLTEPGRRQFFDLSVGNLFLTGA
jgi:hypothetical protein